MTFLFLLILSLFGAVSTRAQTAHFSGSVTTTASRVNFPFDVAVDSSGNLIVADRGSSAIEEFMAAGGYTTSRTLGSGFSYPRGVAIDSNGNVFVADTGNGAVKEILAAGGYTTTQTIGSGFDSPVSVAVDSISNVFVADAAATTVKVILATGGYTTVQNLGSGFSSPSGVAVDSSGNIYVADQGHSAIKQILVAGGYSTINTLGSGLSAPAGLAVDGSANVYVADQGSNAVKEILASGGYSTVKSLGSGYNNPTGVAVDGQGDVFVADYVNRAIKEVMVQAADYGSLPVATPSTLTSTFTFDSGGTLAAKPYLVLTQGTPNLDFTAASPQASDACVAGQTYSAGSTCTVAVVFTPTYPGERLGAVQLMGSAGAPIATGLLHGTGTGPLVTFQSAASTTLLAPTFNTVESVAVDSSGNIFVGDVSSNSIKEIAVGSPATSTVLPVTGLNGPGGIAIDGAGNLYVADAGNAAVKEVLASGGYSTAISLGGGFGYPWGIAVDGSGNVVVADRNNTIYFVPAGCLAATCVKTLGGGFSSPFGVALDPEGNIYIADTYSNAVKQMSSTCTSSSCVTTLASGLQSPSGIAFAPDGHLFVSSFGDGTLKEITPNGTNSSVQTVLPNSGSLFGLALGQDGNLYIANTNNLRVEKLDWSDAPSLSFTTTKVGSTSTDSPQAITVANLGNAALTFEVPASGSNPSVSANFAFASSSTCPQLSSSSSVNSLAAGTSCTVALSFEPSTAGSISGAAVLTDNNANASAPSYITQSISLTGYGTQPTPTQLAASGVAATLTAGQNLGTVTATIEDASGNTATSSIATVTVTITDDNGSSQVVAANAVSGVATLDLSSLPLTTAGNYTVSFSSPQLTGVRAFVVVDAGAAAKLYVGNTKTVSVPANTVVGKVIAIIEDAYGNPLSSSTATVTASVSGPNGYTQTITANAVDGQAKLDLSPVSLATAGSYTFTFSTPNLPSASILITVTAGSASKLVVGSIPGSLVSGGSLGTLTVTIEDSSGNTVTNSTAQVTATITGPNGYSQSVPKSAVAGVASLNLSSLTLTTVGSYTVSFSSTGLTGASAAVSVVAGAANKLIAGTVPSTFTSGGNLGTVLVTVQDVNGNTTSSTAQVTATITGPNGYSQSVAKNAVAGVASLDLSSLTLTTAGSYTVAFSSPSLTGAQTAVAVTAAAASKLLTSAMPSTLISGGNLGTVTATIEDASGNIVSTSTAQVTATLTGPNGYSQAVSASVVNGVANLNLSALPLTTAGSYTVAFSSNGLPGTSALVTVTGGAQTIALPTLPNVTYGVGAVTLPATTSAGLPITYSLTGPAAVNGTSLTVTGAGTVTLTATQAGNGAYTAVTASTTFTVARAASAVSLATSSGVAVMGTSVTLTAQVSTPVGTPSGTVTFLDGSTVLGTGTVSSTGSAALTLETLPTGVLSLMAAYSGDVNFLAGESPATITQVQDFGIAATAGTPAVAVVPGAATSFNFALTPGVAGFSNAITLTASGLPAGATFSFSPVTVTPGSATANSVLTVQTAKSTTIARNLGGAAGITLALLALPFSVSRRTRRLLQGSRLLSLAGALLLLGGVVGLTGCGTSNGFFGQPQQSYTITVTATSGTLSHTAQVVLNVQ